MRLSVQANCLKSGGLFLYLSYEKIYLFFFDHFDDDVWLRGK